MREPATLEELPRITEGVFFTTPERLPRGPHTLGREQVLQAQRERLIIAFTELVAARGYPAVSVGDIATRSGVSRTAFYDCFDSKEACADAAYERFITHLLAELGRRLDGSELDREVTAVLHAYFATLQQDLVVAKAFQLEMDAAGPIARARRRGALLRFAELIRYEQMRLADTDPTINTDLPIQAYLAAVYAVRQLVSDALDREPAPDLVGLVSRVTGWLSAGFRRPAATPIPTTPED
ncbi:MULTISPECIES: TetR/AcrR family transcriptional regulator [unclassified Nocardia]|uniref:TetR/AcrR family transcriptional regulator n=1 Tax=unclassified Nocardia TaxID=2637762 RepID=UPI0030DF08DA